MWPPLVANFLDLWVKWHVWNDRDGWHLPTSHYILPATIATTSTGPQSSKILNLCIYNSSSKVRSIVVSYTYDQFYVCDTVFRFLLLPFLCSLPASASMYVSSTTTLEVLQFSTIFLKLNTLLYAKSNMFQLD